MRRGKKRNISDIQADSSTQRNFILQKNSYAHRSCLYSVYVTMRTCVWVFPETRNRFVTGDILTRTSVFFTLKFNES